MLASGKWSWGGHPSMETEILERPRMEVSCLLQLRRWIWSRYDSHWGCPYLAQRGRTCRQHTDAIHVHLSVLDDPSTWFKLGHEHVGDDRCHGRPHCHTVMRDKDLAVKHELGVRSGCLKKNTELSTTVTRFVWMCSWFIFAVDGSSWI